MNDIDEKIKDIEKRIKTIENNVKYFQVVAGLSLICLVVTCYILSCKIKEIIDFIWEIDRVLRPLVS